MCVCVYICFKFYFVICLLAYVWDGSPQRNRGVCVCVFSPQATVSQREGRPSPQSLCLHTVSLLDTTGNTSVHKALVNELVCGVCLVSNSRTQAGHQRLAGKPVLETARQAYTAWLNVILRCVTVESSNLFQLLLCDVSFTEAVIIDARFSLLVIPLLWCLGGKPVE